MCQRNHLAGEACYHAGLWKGPVEPLTPAALDGVGLVVDGLFGAGLNHPIEGPARGMLAVAAAMGLPIVAVDVPSGLMGDTGDTGEAVKAIMTVTYFRKRPGHVLLPGRIFCGEIVVADIGTPSSVIWQLELDTFENDPDLWLTQVPQPHNGGIKHSYGHALIFGGNPITCVARMAARMAARAAARAGAGLTTIAVPEIAHPSMRLR